MKNVKGNNGVKHVILCNEVWVLCRFEVHIEGTHFNEPKWAEIPQFEATLITGVAFYFKDYLWCFGISVIGWSRPYRWPTIGWSTVSTAAVSR